MELIVKLRILQSIKVHFGNYLIRKLSYWFLERLVIGTLFEGINSRTIGVPFVNVANRFYQHKMQLQCVRNYDIYYDSKSGDNYFLVLNGMIVYAGHCDNITYNLISDVLRNYFCRYKLWNVVELAIFGRWDMVDLKIKQEYEELINLVTDEQCEIVKRNMFRNPEETML